MSNLWAKYEARMNARGLTQRSESLRREQHLLNSRLKDSLSYHTAIVDGVSTEVAIVNSDNLNEKTMFSMPGEDFHLGVIVEWMDNHWLITEKDANNEIYTKVKLLQCNYLLKWVEVIDDVPIIMEQWCVIDDGTKLERIISVRDSLAYWKRYVKITSLIAGNSLEPCHQNRIANSYKWNGLKTIRIGQSAAKLRTGEGSTTSWRQRRNKYSETGSPKLLTK